MLNFIKDITLYKLKKKMAQKKQVTDEIRLKIMDALFKEDVISINISKIQEHTGLHKNTIKDSIDYLKEEGVFENYTPNYNLEKLGFKAFPLIIYEEDRTFPIEKIKDHLEKSMKDPHMYQKRSITGYENYNTIALALFKNIEEYHEYRDQEFYNQNPELYKYIKKPIRLYQHWKLDKDINISRAAIDILIKETETENHGKL